MAALSRIQTPKIHGDPYLLKFEGFCRAFVHEFLMRHAYLP
jgi:hypothetical protein